MRWFDDYYDDADLGDFDTRSQITVDQLLRREGFRPAGPRVRRRALTGVAWVAFGAVVSAVVWHQPIGTLLAAGSTTDAMPDTAQSPAGGTDPSVQAATRAGTIAAVPHDNQPPANAGAPNPPAVVVIPPSASTVSTRPRSTLGKHAPQRTLPALTSAVAQVAPVVAPVATAVAAPVTPVVNSASGTLLFTIQPSVMAGTSGSSFGWFDGASSYGSGWFGGQSYGGGCWGRGR